MDHFAQVEVLPFRIIDVAQNALNDIETTLADDTVKVCQSPTRIPLQHTTILNSGGPQHFRIYFHRISYTQLQ